MIHWQRNDRLRNDLRCALKNTAPSREKRASRCRSSHERPGVWRKPQNYVCLRCSIAGSAMHSIHGSEAQSESMDAIARARELFPTISPFSSSLRACTRVCACVNYAVAQIEQRRRNVPTHGYACHPVCVHPEGSYARSRGVTQGGGACFTRHTIPTNLSQNAPPSHYY